MRQQDAFASLDLIGMLRTDCRDRTLPCMYLAHHEQDYGQIAVAVIIKVQGCKGCSR